MTIKEALAAALTRSGTPTTDDIDAINRAMRCPYGACNGLPGCGMCSTDADRRYKSIDDMCGFCKLEYLNREFIPIGRK